MAPYTWSSLSAADCGAYAMAPSSSASYGEGKGKTIVIVVDDEDETILADDRGKTLLGKNTMITSTAASDMTKGKGLTKDPTKGMTEGRRA